MLAIRSPFRVVAIRLFQSIADKFSNDDLSVIGSTPVQWGRQFKSAIINQFSNENAFSLIEYDGRSPGACWFRGYLRNQVMSL